MTGRGYIPDDEDCNRKLAAAEGCQTIRRDDH